MKDRTGILIILDGFGTSSEERFNAVKAAHTPTFDALFSRYPHTTLDASADKVGLPEGFMGNSEVGHLNIGAGRIVYQDFSLISHAIEEGSFYENEALSGVMKKVRETKGASLHLMGLVSDGGVHSHVSHLYALIEMAKRLEVPRVYVHVFTDGRDTPPTSGVEFLQDVRNRCAEMGLGQVVTVSGRFYAMDRDKRWERTEQAYETVVAGRGDRVFGDPVEYVRRNYNAEVTDEFIPPARLKSYSGARDGDGFIFFNFRADRARQLTQAIIQTEFPHFRRENFPTLSGFVTMTSYDDTFEVPVAFGKPKVPRTLGEVVSKMGVAQLRIAETEKYAHVTYFFNGGDEKVFPGEERVLIPSPREVKTYDLKPEMSAEPLTDRLIQELDSGKYRFVVVNYANCDMVGHTGNFPAAVKAVETVDRCVGRVVDWVEKHGAFALLTSDHGNCEQMLDATGAPLTSHTMNRVPLVLIDPQKRDWKFKGEGRLCDIAPTFLSVWGVTPPAEMTGEVLVRS